MLCYLRSPRIEAAEYSVYEVVEVSFSKEGAEGGVQFMWRTNSTKPQITPGCDTRLPLCLILIAISQSAMITVGKLTREWFEQAIFSRQTSAGRESSNKLRCPKKHQDPFHARPCPSPAAPCSDKQPAPRPVRWLGIRLDFLGALVVFLAVLVAVLVGRATPGMVSLSPPSAGQSLV